MPLRGEHLLGVDLGGTKGLLGLFEAGRKRPTFQRYYRCAEFTGFEPMLAQFLDEVREHLGVAAARPVAACIALAGPVEGQRATMTNLPWTLDAADLRRRFDFGALRLANDFVAAAAGIAALGPDDVRVLQAGEPRPVSPRVIVGPGTGLGAAMMIPVGSRWRIIGGEGGHLGLAPRSELEGALLHWLWKRHGRVSAERVLCGPGLVMLYRFLAQREGACDDADDPLLRAADPAAAIGMTATDAYQEAAGVALEEGATVAHDDRSSRSSMPDARAALELAPAAQARHVLRAGRALDLFASMLGAFAGDLGLLALPRAGLYLGGGIAPKVFDARRTALFLAALRDKGRHASLMDRIPVRLVVEPVLGLIGAGLLAAGRARVVGERSARRRREPDAMPP